MASAKNLTVRPERARILFIDGLRLFSPFVNLEWTLVRSFVEKGEMQRRWGEKQRGRFLK